MDRVTLGHVDCVKLCLEMGANVNSRSNVGFTPLHFAATAGKTVDVARMLLDGGAIVDPKDDDETTPLQRAIVFNHVDVAHLSHDICVRMGISITHPVFS
jgi:ankyrin repeat protein